MKRFTITYLERTRENYDREYPGIYSEGSPHFYGRVRRVAIQAESCEQAWTLYVEGLKLDGWKLYTFDTLIKDGITVSSISVNADDDPAHHFGYGLTSVITEVAENAQPGWFD